MNEFGIDRKLYFRVSDLYERGDWEITWNKGTSYEPWKIRRVGEDSWKTLSPENITAQLTSRKIDVADFERQLTSNVFTYIVFCHTAMREARKLLGDDAVDVAIDQHEKFAEELLKTIRALDQNFGKETNSDSKTKAASDVKSDNSLKNPIEEAASARQKSTGLTLVKNN